jgi:hypothetical protein
MNLRDRYKWHGLISGCVFLAVSTYMHVKYVFWDTRAANTLLLAAMASSLLALIFGLMSLPRWQSYCSLAVFVYACYWFTQPAYAIP